MGSKQGRCRTPAYRSWSAMNQRCNYLGHKNWKHYGGRGIKICKRWKSFKLFLEDMGPRPPKHTLERVDYNKDYTPSNVIWADAKTQARNKINNVVCTFRGKTQTLIEWSEELKLPYSRLRIRLNVLGWTVDRAFTTPSQVRSSTKDHTYTVNGETHNLKDWSVLVGVPYKTMLTRINQLGWSPKKAITTPSRKLS